MEPLKWFNRKFDFSFTQNIFPSIVERLSGTPVRLEEKISGISTELITLKHGGSWSVKENIGHLTDLEPLWQERFKQIKKGLTTMEPADLQNTATHNANHNTVPVQELLKQFREIRQQTLGMIEDIDEELIFRSAIHPRLGTPMRTMDLFLFVAEHDDHHLARISELARLPYNNK